MPDPIPVERLAEIAACERETRDGPWILADANDGDGIPPMWVLATSEVENEDCDWAVHIHVGDKQVGEFIAMARTAVPELLAEVDRLTRELDDAREANRIMREAVRRRRAEQAGEMQDEADQQDSGYWDAATRWEFRQRTGHQPDPGPTRQGHDSNGQRTGAPDA